MRAIVCHEHGGPEVLVYEEVPVPKPGAGELLVAAEAIGVNYVDTMRRSGNHPAAPQPPFVPGIEFCGRVVAAGSGTDRFRPGDRVIGRCVTNGAYAEQVIIEARFASHCPEQLSAEEGAALFVNGQTAYHALKTVGQLQSGESVLITAAAGGVGCCAVQIARLLGANAIAAAGTGEKRQLAASLGAGATVDYTLSDWPQAVLAATENRGVDLILESVGGDVARQALSCWAPGGRLVIYGKASGQSAKVTGDDLLFGNRTASGMAVGMVIEDEALMRRAMDELVAWVAAGQLRLQIGKRYPLSAARTAHEDLQSRRTQGKLILLPEASQQKR